MEEDGTGNGRASKRQKLNGSGVSRSDGQPAPWPGPPALRRWRESGREAHFYAYAGAFQSHTGRAVSLCAMLDILYALTRAHIVLR